MTDFNQSQVWTQRDGTQICVVDMSDRHLVNTLEMLRRAAPRIYEREVIHFYIYCPGPSGDIEFDGALSADPWKWLKRKPLVKAMRKELKRRKLA